jgi:hypothetical protein
MFGDRAREAFARQHRCPQARDHGTKPADIGVVGQQFERIVEPCAGLQ